MKTLLHHTDNASRFQNISYFYRQRAERAVKSNTLPSESSGGVANEPKNQSTHRIHDLFTPDTIRKMVSGQIPDLWGFCLDLAGLANSDGQPDSAMAFIPLLQLVNTLEREEAIQFGKNGNSRHVLAASDKLEIVLIHWEPGKTSDIHGHPEGGCLFKLLYGNLKELRYTPDTSSQLLAQNSYRKGSMAYIDNRMAYHQVENPYKTTAVSLHIYLK